MIVGCPGRVCHPSHLWRIWIAGNRSRRRFVMVVGKGCQTFQPVRTEPQSLIMSLVPRVEFMGWCKCRQPFRRLDGNLGISSEGFGEAAESTSPVIGLPDDALVGELGLKMDQG